MFLPARNITPFVALAFSCLLAATALLYWPGLSGPFLLDDFENLKSVSDFEAGRIGWIEATLSNHSGPLNRPVAMATFVANMAFNGPDVWAFKYTNLMIHLLCGVLVFALSSQLFGLTHARANGPEIRHIYALTVTAFWLLAPMNATTTLYIVQRMTQLSALFSLCAMAAYTAGRIRLLQRDDMKAWGLVISSVVLWFPLAVLSKENAVLLPLLLFVIEIFFLRFRGSANTRLALKILFGAILALPAAVALSLLLLRPELFLGGYQWRDFNLYERVLTEGRVLFFYLKKLLIPQMGGAGLYYDDYPRSTSLLAPASTLVAAMAWAGIVASLIAMTVLSRLRSLLPLGFGIAFYLAGHALESTIFPLELVFEHRNYLPSFGVFFSLVYGFALVAGLSPFSKKAIVVLIGILVIAFALLLRQQANVWSSRERMLAVSAVEHPGSARVHADLALLYATQGNVDGALSHLQKLEALAPETATGVALQRILTYCLAGRPITREVYDSIPTQARDISDIYTLLTLREINRLVYSGGCPSLNAALIAHRLANILKGKHIENRYRTWHVHFELAQLFFETRDLKNAITHAQKAVALNPGEIEARLILIRYLLIAKDRTGAQEALDVLTPTLSNMSPHQAESYQYYRKHLETP